MSPHSNSAHGMRSLVFPSSPLQLRQGAISSWAWASLTVKPANIILLGRGGSRMVSVAEAVAVVGIFPILTVRQYGYHSSVGKHVGFCGADVFVYTTGT